jgi:hypothetical protein
LQGKAVRLTERRYDEVKKEPVQFQDGNDKWIGMTWECVCMGNKVDQGSTFGVVDETNDAGAEGLRSAHCPHFAKLDHDCIAYFNGEQPQHC